MLQGLRVFARRWNARPGERVLKVVGFVASAPGFNAQPKVIDAASSFWSRCSATPGGTRDRPLVSPSCRATHA